MRILQCISSIDVGGAENFVIELCNELASDTKNTVFLVSFYEAEKSRLNKISKNVDFYCLKKKNGFDLGLVLRLFSLITKLKPNIIHTHLRVLYYILGFSIIFKKVSFFHTIHYNPQTESDNYLVSAFKKFCFKRNYIKPVFLTERLLKLGYKTYGSGGIILDNGIKKENGSILDTEVLDFFNDLKSKGFDNIFTHVGRICKIKNQKLLIDTFNRLNESKSKAYLVFIGYATDSDKPLEEKLHQRANSRNIIFLNEKTRVREYLHHSIGFCLTSKNEGQPISIIEALSEGCIPICTSVGGIPDMYSKDEGFLTSLDLDSYFDAIKKVIELTPLEKQKFANNCTYTFNEKYSIESSANKHMKQYSSLGS